MKRCRTCGKRKRTDQFFRRGGERARKNGLRQTKCKACLRQELAEWADASKKWIREYCRRWREGHRGVVDAANGFIDRARGRGVADGLTPYYRARHEAILAYGGYRCACCGVTEPLFLTLDHVNNGGTQHRNRLGSGSTKFYTWLKSKKYPPGFQVLCSNCNHGRYRNGGVCPHKTEK